MPSSHYYLLSGFCRPRLKKKSPSLRLSTPSPSPRNSHCLLCTQSFRPSHVPTTSSQRGVPNLFPTLTPSREDTSTGSSGLGRQSRPMRHGARRKVHALDLVVAGAILIRYSRGKSDRPVIHGRCDSVGFGTEEGATGTRAREEGATGQLSRGRRDWLKEQRKVRPGPESLQKERCRMICVEGRNGG